MQGWEFAHQFSERITRYLQKNEQMSNLSNLLISLIKKEGMSESLFFLKKKMSIKCTQKYDFSQIFLSESLICSFIMSDLRESLTVAHLSWAIWGNEQVSDERMSFEPMNEFPALG